MKISEKIRIIRKTNNFTQADFAKTIGISRGNLANIELGKVEPTQVFINCVSLMYNIDKNWLTDDSNSDLSVLNNSTSLHTRIMEKYRCLNDKHKKYVEDQINRLLAVQDNPKSKDSGH